jgi:hypothetical protein
MAWLEDWAKRIPIEIDRTKIDENLTDFPVLITVTGTEVFDALTVSGGVDAYDILFVDTCGDESSAANAIKIGQPSSTVIGPKFTVYSGIKCIYFDGSDDVMYCDTNTAYNFGVGDFTIEAWVNMADISTYYTIMGRGNINTTDGDWRCVIGNVSGNIKMLMGIRSAGTIYDLASNNFDGQISVGSWNHVAVSRSAGTLFFFLNGTQVGSVACSYSLSSSSALYLGCRAHSSGYYSFLGYITKWRVSKDIARYTSTFAAPTNYTNDSYTTFLFMNGPNNNIAPSDLEVNSYGETLVSRATTPFNRNASWDFGLASNDLIFVYDNSHLDLGSYDFTIDGWAYIKSYDAQGRTIISKRTAYLSSYMWIVLGVSSTGYMTATASNNGTSWGINFTGSYVPVNTWFHFAYVRTGNTFDLYYNGIKTNTGTMTGAIVKDSNSLSIGAGDNSNNSDWYGYIYGLRLSKGIARYSDNFIPSDPLDFNTSFNNRKKIAITDANNNQLYTEIERWDHANKKAWVWTKVPTVASGTNTKLYLYYDKTKVDNTNYVGDTASIPAQKVWDSNFMAVYHLSTGYSSINYFKDATASGNHISSVGGGITAANTVTAKIGYGLDLEKDSTQYCNLPAGCSLQGKTQATHEAIINLESHSTIGYSNNPCYESTSNASYTRFSVQAITSATNTTRARTLYRNSTTGDTGTPVLVNDTYDLALSTYYYIAGTYNSDSGNCKLFRNGVRVVLDTTTKTPFTNTAPAMMRIGYDSSAFDGIVEEVRISSIERSEAWLKATYYSNWNDLLFFSSAEIPPVYTCSGIVTVDDLPTDGIPVCLYRRSTGQLAGRETTISGGHFTIDSIYNEDHYVVALYTASGTNAKIYDFIHP